MKLVLRKGFMYKISQKPDTILYVSENKTLAGKEDKANEGEASGRKLVVTFFEAGDDGKVHRVDREGCALRPQLLNIADILQSLGFVLPPDPARTSAVTELLLEEHYQTLQIMRFTCALDTEAPEVHVYSLAEEVDAEEAMALELSPEARTKMVLVRSLQRADALQEDETLERAWASSLATLQARAAPLFPAAPARAGGRGRGRGRGRGGGR